MPIFLFFGLWATPSAWAEEYSRWVLGLKSGYFTSGQSGWDDIYGKGGVEISGQTAFKIFPQWEIGLELGYFNDTGTARTASGVLTARQQKIQLLPFNLSLSYHLIFDQDQLFVPFAGGGYSYVFFLHSLDGQDTKSGDRHGYHGKAGLKILLDVLDPNGAVGIKQDWGIQNTYFVMEAQYSQADDFGGDAADLGGWRYLGGILVEF